MGPDQGAAEQPLPRGFPSRSPGSAGPLRRVSPRRPGSPSRPGGVRGRARIPTSGPCPLPPRNTAARAASLGLTAPSASFRGEAASSGTKPGTPPGLSLRAPAAGRGAAAAAGPALGPPGGLPLFPCCTTVTVAASSAIMKGRQCAGERREPGTSR